MSNINTIAIGGNLVTDPKTYEGKNGQKVTRMRIASNRTFGAGDQRQEETTFVDCVAFGSRADVASQYLTKGRQVNVTGRLVTNAWKADDGSPRSRLEIAVQELHLGPKSQGADAGDNDPDDDGDVPF